MGGRVMRCGLLGKEPRCQSEIIALVARIEKGKLVGRGRIVESMITIIIKTDN